MELMVYATIELDDGIQIVGGDTVRVVMEGSGAVVEGRVSKISKKNMEIALPNEMYYAKVVFEDIADIAKL